MIEHDAAADVWTLTYTLHPKPTDRFGGVLTLADGGRLAGWEGEQGLIVKVSGAVDPSAGTDALGKPKFRVAAAEPLGYHER